MNIEIIKTSTVTNSLDSTREFGSFLLKANSIIKMLHWFTLNYNTHKILGNLYEDLDELFDKLEEEIIGSCRSNNVIFPKINSIQINLNIEDVSQFTEENIANLYYKTINEILNIITSLEFKNFITQVKSGLNNTTEEIISRINKSNYLLTLV